jgi:hypothetical protein
MVSESQEYNPTKHRHLPAAEEVDQEQQYTDPNEHNIEPVDREFSIATAIHKQLRRAGARTYFDISKEGKVTFKVDSSSDLDQLGPDRSVDGAMDGSLKLIIGKNGNQHESLIVDQDGGTRLTVWGPSRIKSRHLSHLGNEDDKEVDDHPDNVWEVHGDGQTSPGDRPWEPEETSWPDAAMPRFVPSANPIGDYNVEDERPANYEEGDEDQDQNRGNLSDSELNGNDSKGSAWDISLEGNVRLFVRGNLDLHVTGNVFQRVRGNVSEHIHGDHYRQVDGNFRELIKGNVKKDILQNSDNAVHANRSEWTKENHYQQVVKDQYVAIDMNRYEWIGINDELDVGQDKIETIGNIKDVTVSVFIRENCDDIRHND